MTNITAPAHKRNHVATNPWLKNPVHPETVERMAHTGLNLEDFDLANFRHHLKRCREILETFAQMQAEALAAMGKVGHISFRDIASRAKCSRETVKKAFNYTLDEISLQLDKAVDLCRYRSKRNRKILSFASPQKTERQLEADQTARDFQKQLQEDKAKRLSKGSRSVRLRPLEMKAFIQRHIAPSRWRFIEENILKRIKKKMEIRKDKPEEQEEKIALVRGQVPEYVLDRRRPLTARQIEEYEYAKSIGLVNGPAPTVQEPIKTEDRPPLEMLRKLAGLKPKIIDEPGG